MSVKIPAATGISGIVSAQYWSLFWRGIVIIILCVMIAIGQSSKKNAKVVSDDGSRGRFVAWWKYPVSDPRQKCVPGLGLDAKLCFSKQKMT